MAHRTTLTEFQVTVLRWVAGGCTDAVTDRAAHRISAAALRNRGLLTISGQGRTWNAKLTKAGVAYLNQVEGPDPPTPRQANRSVTQQLVDDVIAAGGSLRVPKRDWYTPGGIDYERRALLAERHGKVPADKRLVVAAISHKEWQIDLVDAPGFGVERSDLRPVDVPVKVSRYHEVARAFRDNNNQHEVSRALLPRAVKIIHSIALESERRGWTVGAPSVGSVGDHGGGGWSGTGDGHVRIGVDGHEFWLRLHEEGVHCRGRWEEDVARYRNRSRWFSDRERDIPSGPYDAKATGRLHLELFVPRPWTFRGRQSRWADRQSWRLEERLPHLFREIDERTAEAHRIAEQERIAAVHAAEAAKRAAEERERTWRALMQEAARRLVHTHRVEHLQAQAESWHLAENLRRYCAAMRTTHGDNPQTAEWLAWAADYVDQLDPLSSPPLIPESPEATPEALQPHLPRGWSASGPEEGRSASIARSGYAS